MTIMKISDTPFMNFYTTGEEQNGRVVNSKVVTYSASELEERKKADWSRSKEVTSRLYPRWERNPYGSLRV